MPNDHAMIRRTFPSGAGESDVNLSAGQQVTFTVEYVCEKGGRSNSSVSSESSSSVPSERQ